MILRKCLTHGEAEKVLNDFHSSSCGGNLFGHATAQNILHIGYFLPTIFHYFILMVRSCYACQSFYRKFHKLPALMHHVIVVGPFEKWGIDFMTYNPHYSAGHGYINVAVEYFTKWAEAMRTFNKIGETTTLFFFNHDISLFGVP